MGVAIKQLLHPNEGWGEFRRRLEQKAEAATTSTLVVAVPPAYTSQQCFRCGHVAEGNRENQADFLCTACGHESNADVNAALNIEQAALKRKRRRACGVKTWRLGVSWVCEVSTTRNSRTRFGAGMTFQESPGFSHGEDVNVIRAVPSMLLTLRSAPCPLPPSFRMAGDSFRRSQACSTTG